MEVREQHARNDGRDPCSVLIRRHRVPKDRDSVPPTFPSACLELTRRPTCILSIYYSTYVY